MIMLFIKCYSNFNFASLDWISGINRITEILKTEILKTSALWQMQLHYVKHNWTWITQHCNQTTWKD